MSRLDDKRYLNQLGPRIFSFNLYNSRHTIELDNEKSFTVTTNATSGFKVEATGCTLELRLLHSTGVTGQLTNPTTNEKVLKTPPTMHGVLEVHRVSSGKELNLVESKVFRVFNINVYAEDGTYLKTYQRDGIHHQEDPQRVEFSTYNMKTPLDGMVEIFNDQGEQ